MFEDANLFTSLVGFVLVLAPLIIVHELGHYLAARWCGVQVEAFSVGFGRELAGFTDRRGTRWKLSAMPLGGYVQFAGDMNPASQPSDEWLNLPPEERERTFQAKSLGARAAIVAAGPLTNLMLAVLIIAAFVLAYGQLVAEPVVGELEEGSPAAMAGMEIGDRVVRIDGDPVNTFDELRDHVLPYPGEAITLVYERNGREIETNLVVGTHVERDRFGNEFTMGRIGVAVTDATTEAVGPIEALNVGITQTGQIMKITTVGLWQIITGRRPVDELGGPIKIAKFSGEQLVSGWRAFIGFIAMISINLAFINLLPIPALDGGHLAFYAAEAVRRKPISEKGQEWAFRTGMALVLALMVFVTLLDISSLDIFAGSGAGS